MRYIIEPQVIHPVQGVLKVNHQNNYTSLDVKDINTSKTKNEEITWKYPYIEEVYATIHGSYKGTKQYLISTKEINLA